jgi:flagellar hook protein FlgE
MSFYTALTGLNGAQSDISATSNNIANVGTTGFKRSRAEFGDIFATSPLQNSSSSIGSGTILKGIKQQFTQGNISSSLNALDLAISGQGFFALKPSLTSAQTVYTRNGSLNVNNDRYVVDSAGQYLLVYPVNEDGSVTAKDLIPLYPYNFRLLQVIQKQRQILILGSTSLLLLLLFQISLNLRTDTHLTRITLKPLPTQHQ